MEDYTLYNKLDKIYKDLLAKFVFPQKQVFNDEEPQNITEVRALAIQLLAQSSDCYKYKIAAMTREKNPNNNFNTIAKLARIEKSNSELYQEVYNEVFKNYTQTTLTEAGNENINFSLLFN